MERKILVKYVRGSKNHKIGCVVATGPGEVGWSLAMKIDRKKGLNKSVAVNMAIIRTKNSAPVPKSIMSEYEAMIDRSKRYFK